MVLTCSPCKINVPNRMSEPIAVGDVLPNMPLFLEPNGCVMVPLEAMYQTAYAVLPRRWQRVLEASPS
jgi:hypothetical protein